MRSAEDGDDLATLSISENGRRAQEAESYGLVTTLLGGCLCRFRGAR